MDATEKARFTAIVEPQFDVLYRTALRLTRDAADAEDLVQDVCLRAASRLAELEAVTDHRAWFLRVQYRIFVDGHRRRLRSPLRALDSVSEDCVESAADQPALDEFADGIASRDSLNRAWRRLDCEQRVLLSLHAEGHDLSDIATITGIPKPALSARLYRARSRFAKALRGGPAMVFAVDRLES